MTATSKTHNDFFSAFSSYLNDNFSRPNKVEKESIRNGPKRIRRLDSLARLIIKENTLDNCAAVAVRDNKWYFTANNYQQIKPNLKIIFSALDKLEKNDKGMVCSTKKARNYLLEKYLNHKSVTKHPNTHKRLVRDVKKFLSSLKTNSIFTKKEITSLLGPNYYYYKNKKAIHAEMTLLSKLSDPSKDQVVTLGISKLCCKLCAAGVLAFKKHYPNQEIQFRGRHGNFYYGWKPSELLLNDCLAKFVGDKAYKIFASKNNKAKNEIIAILSDLESNRKFLSKFFTPSRGGVTVNSDSPTAISSEKSTSSDEISSDDSQSSEEQYDSTSDVE
jgi:hypothetical protein